MFKQMFKNKSNYIFNWRDRNVKLSFLILEFPNFVILFYSSGHWTEATETKR